MICHICFLSLYIKGYMSDDALNAYKMNVRPGGKQPVMRDTEWSFKN